MHENLAFQLGLSSLDSSDLAEQVRSHLTFGGAGTAATAGAEEAAESAAPADSAGEAANEALEVAASEKEPSQEEGRQK